MPVCAPAPAPAGFQTGAETEIGIGTETETDATTEIVIETAAGRAGVGLARSSKKYLFNVTVITHRRVSWVPSGLS